MKKSLFTALFTIVCLLFIISNTSAETVIKQQVTVKFPNDVREGIYSGEINPDGVPDGFGVFEAVNSLGNRYIIVGQWQDGHQTGEAWKVWDNGDLNIGQFNDSHFIYGTYVRNAIVQEYDERPRDERITEYTGNPELIPYESLKNYRELFDPDQKGLEDGSVPVMIQAIISKVYDTKLGYNVDMWINGNKGYYYYRCSVDLGRESDTCLEKPVAGQTVIYELTPYGDGTFSWNQIRSVQVIEESTDFRIIHPAELISYTKLEDKIDMKHSIIELVIGDKYDDQYEVWIKDDEGYRRKMISASFSPVYGQRIIAVMKPYNPLVYSDTQFESYVIAENDIDVQAIEKDYYLSDEVTKHYVDPFNASSFTRIPYKSILRDSDAYKGAAICFEGIFQQKLGSIDSIVKDIDGNYYHLYIRKNAIDFKLLEKDRIKVYGYVLNDTFEYSSLLGAKEVPSILVKHIDLVEDN